MIMPFHFVKEFGLRNKRSKYLLCPFGLDLCGAKVNVAQNEIGGAKADQQLWT